MSNVRNIIRTLRKRQRAAEAHDDEEARARPLSAAHRKARAVLRVQQTLLKLATADTRLAPDDRDWLESQWQELTAFWLREAPHFDAREAEKMCRCLWFTRALTKHRLHASRAAAPARVPARSLAEWHAWLRAGLEPAHLWTRVRETRLAQVSADEAALAHARQQAALVAPPGKLVNDAETYFYWMRFFRVELMGQRDEQVARAPAALVAAVRTWLRTQVLTTRTAPAQRLFRHAALAAACPLGAATRCRRRFPDDTAAYGPEFVLRNSVPAPQHEALARLTLQWQLSDAKELDALAPPTRHAVFFAVWCYKFQQYVPGRDRFARWYAVPWYRWGHPDAHASLQVETRCHRPILPQVWHLGNAAWAVVGATWGLWFRSPAAALAEWLVRAHAMYGGALETGGRLPTFGLPIAAAVESDADDSAPARDELLRASPRA